MRVLTFTFRAFRKHWEFWAGAIGTCGVLRAKSVTGSSDAWQGLCFGADVDRFRSREK